MSAGTSLATNTPASAGWPPHRRNPSASATRAAATTPGRPRKSVAHGQFRPANTTSPAACAASNSPSVGGW